METRKGEDGFTELASSSFASLVITGGGERVTLDGDGESVRRAS